jgi:hypothetical protein
MGALFAVCFAAGVGLLVLGLAREPQPLTIGSWSTRLFARRESLRLAPAPLGGLSAVLASIAALLVWSLVASRHATLRDRALTRSRRTGYSGGSLRQVSVAARATRFRQPRR